MADKTETKVALKDRSTHTLEELINLLTDVKNKLGGDTPIIYWDQDQDVKMNPDHLVHVENRMIYFGGFHVNGEEFYDQDM